MHKQCPRGRGRRLLLLVLTASLRSVLPLMPPFLPACQPLVMSRPCLAAGSGGCAQGSLEGYALQHMCDDRGPVVVRMLVERLEQEQEAGWLDAIAQELINRRTYAHWRLCVCVRVRVRVCVHACVV